MVMKSKVKSSSPKIQKAIELAELEKDRAQLQAQAQAINGAIQYINQKIALLNKAEATEEEQKP